VAPVIQFLKQSYFTMNKLVIFLSLLLIGLSSCKKDDFNLTSQNHPEIPVTVSNIYGYFNGVPSVYTSFSAGGNIAIQLNIPPDKGRTIKEITKVALGSNTTNYAVVHASTGLYNSAPIAGNGTSVTFNTTIAEYTTKTGFVVTSAISGLNNSFLNRYFYFLVTLDDGQQLIPVPVRVYVDK
jgi:hypothetical protein